MPGFLLPLALTAASAIGGALSNSKKARTATNAPTLAPEYKTLSDLLRGRAEERLRGSVDLGGYQAQGLSDINDVFKGREISTEADLTRRGLARSPIANVARSGVEQDRSGTMVDFLNSIPLLQRQFQNEDMSNALQVLNLGRGTETVAPGSAAGGAFGSAAEMLAFLSGQGLLGGGKKTTPFGLPGSFGN